ncbi:MAG: hypothetical protein QMD82_08045 [bacterium]|nr:hypothetical protein [bacterium]
MLLLLIMLVSQFNPTSEISDFYSGRYFATSFLLKGPQELIQNPSYLFLMRNSHLFSNFSNFFSKGKLFIFGGNFKSEPLMEGGLVKIGGEKYPLSNIFGTKGYFRKDTLQYEDTDFNGSYDRARVVKFEVNGDSTIFNLAAVVGFQFVHENWFVSASFLKSQFNKEYQNPGDTLKNFGYFNYSMIEATYPDNRFIMQKTGSGDYVRKDVDNQSFVRIGGGVIIDDSSFISLLLGYKTSEQQTTIGGYFSWTVDTDTTREETHVLYDQSRVDEGISFLGKGYSLNLDYYLPKGLKSFREAGIFVLRERKAVDNITKIEMGYLGNYNTVIDTFIAKYDSLSYNEENFTSYKGKTENYFKAYYTEVFELNSSTRIAFGINGFYRYCYLNLSYRSVDSLYVRYLDGDTLSSDPDDYERFVIQNKVGQRITEGKEYAIQFPVAVEVNPFNLKGLTLWFGSLFNFTHEIVAEELKIIPLGERVDSIIRGDSSTNVIITPISQVRQRASSSSESSNVFLTYGLSVELSKNITVDAYFRNRLSKFDFANFGVTIRF